MILDEEALSSWIQHRRWYATKNLPIESLHVVSQTPIALNERIALHTVVAVTTQAGTDLYQLILASANRDYVENNVLSESVISTSGDPIYELFGDSTALLGLVDVFNQGQSFPPLVFHLSQPLPPASTARVISSEQSNTSVIFGDHSIAKFYRRLTPGINPDLEVGHALDQCQCQCVPRVRGWVEGEIRGTPTTLFVIHEYFPTAVDGFEHALASVRDLIASDVNPDQAGGDFAAEAERLGLVVRSMHEDLAVVLGKNTQSLETLVDSMQQRLHLATQEVPALMPYQDALSQRFESLRNEKVLVQRIHGDLHLGQVLRDPSGWKILDFEGEPGAALEERRAMAPAARDVAGMLRSFDYAARQPLLTHPDKERLLPRTTEWAARNRAAFLAGYGEEASHINEIFELDKAVYEALYEHRFRPDWIEVPLGGIARLLEV